MTRTAVYHGRKIEARKEGEVYHAFLDGRRVDLAPRPYGRALIKRVVKMLRDGEQINLIEDEKERIESRFRKDNKVNFTTFTRRTDDPKLSWLEEKLSQAGIAHRRNGESFHAPILEVDETKIEAAWDILKPVDGMSDDDPMFEV